MRDTEIDVATLDQWRRNGREVTVLDVREPWETEICALSGSMFIPMNALPQRVADLPSDKEIVVLCHHGVRSAHAAAWLRRQGFSHVLNLAGGIDAWARQIDTEMEVY